MDQKENRGLLILELHFVLEKNFLPFQRLFFSFQGLVAIVCWQEHCVAVSTRWMKVVCLCGKCVTNFPYFDMRSPSCCLGTEEFFLLNDRRFSVEMDISQSKNIFLRACLQIMVQYLSIIIN